jgi:hypothetical protein
MGVYDGGMHKAAGSRASLLKVWWLIGRRGPGEGGFFPCFVELQPDMEDGGNFKGLLHVMETRQTFKETSDCNLRTHNCCQ